MKVSAFWILFIVVGTALMFFSISSTTSSVSDVAFSSHADAAVAFNRKLKEKSHSPSTIEKEKRDVDNLNMEDYHLIDPVPSSKAAIKTGPIEHGTPLMPYIPKPAPPVHPKHVGAPQPI